MSKQIKQQEPIHITPNNIFYVYEGEKRYKSLQPIPYKYLKPKLSLLKENKLPIILNNK